MNQAGGSLPVERVALWRNRYTEILSEGEVLNPQAEREVVVVNDKFGIRLTDIVTPSERARQIGR